MWDFVRGQSGSFAVVLLVFLVVSLVENRVAATPPIPWRDRLLNSAAAVLFIFPGGYLALLALSWYASWGAIKGSTLSAPVYCLCFLLLQDVIYYFYHRLQHALPVLWGIHKLHHTDPDVNITTSHRTHLAEQAIQTTLIFLPCFLLLGYHPSGTTYAYLASSFLLYLGHSRLNLGMGPLTRVVVGPRYHRLHHSMEPAHHNRNFAQLFPLLDMLFGTYAAPGPRLAEATGVAGCETRRDQWAPLLWPIPLPPRGFAR